MKRFLLLLAVALVPTSIFAQTFKTVVSAPEGVSMTVFAGFADSARVMQPVSKTASGDKIRYVYELASGNYHFVSSGYNYFTLKKNFMIKDKAKEIDADPGMKGEKGFQPTWMTYSYTDEVNAAELSVTGLTKRFPKVMTTPGFSANKPVSEHTTQLEMEAYLSKLDKSDRNMHLFTAGYSTLGMKLPLVVYTTDNIEGMSLEEAGALLSSDGKPMIMMHAQIHGDENSPGEAALGMCAELSGAYGAKVLPEINVIILPRVNCDGTKAWTRGTSVAPDMNRDNLLVRNPEIKATHRVYNSFHPTIVLDMHEYNVKANYAETEGFLDDAGITVGGNQNNSRVLNEFQKGMMRYVEKTGMESGLRYWEYTQAGYSDQSPLHASHYYALRSSANFLVETPNSRCDKKSSFARRVFTHVFAAQALIEYAISHTEELLAACKADREHVISSRDPFILRYGQNEKPYEYIRAIFDLATGQAIKDTTFSVRYYEVPLITRPRPAAYVIPKDVRNIKSILEIAAYNEISYEELPEGAKMDLKQYAQNPKWRPAVQPVSGSGKKFVADDTQKCLLLEPQESVFPKGAYLFKTDQPSAIVLMYLMEPDVVKTDRYPITLVQAHLIQLKDIYRLEY